MKNKAMPNVPINNLSKSLSLILAISLLSAAHAGAQIIIQDNFTGTSGSIGGQMPSGANLPGGTYYTLPTATTYTGSGQAQLSTNTAADIAFFSSTYTPPDDLQISANLTLGSIGSNSFYRGIGLGFYSVPQNLSNNGSQEGSADFFGIVLNPSGVLSLISSAGSTNYDVADSAAIAGFSTSTTYTLSYQVDVPTGAVSNLTLNGTPVPLTFNGTYTNDVIDPNKVAYVGFYGSSSSYGGTGTISNFELQAVAAPEPSTSALLVAGLGMALVIAARRRLV